MPDLTPEIAPDVTSPPSRPVRRFLLSQLICVLVLGGVSALFWGRQALIAEVVGGAVAAMNAIGTAFAWPRILEKKDIALSLSIIVSKFALSIGVFYWLTRPSAFVWFGDQATTLGSATGTLVAFALGLASVVPAAITVAVGDLFGKNTRRNDEREQ